MKIENNKPNTYFSADWHLFHVNIIKYSNRPFCNSAEMNRVIQENMNSRIRKIDYLYFLGDMAFCKRLCNLEYWLSKLNCKNIFFIKGNHDKTAIQIKDKFIWFKNFEEITVENQPITLCHYAMRVWNKSHYGAWHLYGHSHGSLPDDPNSLSIDIGVDTNNFYPYSFDEIKKIMSKKKFVPIDHHKDK